MILTDGSRHRITMQLLDVNGSIVRSMSANYPTLQQQTFDEVSPWQQVRTIRLSWQTGSGNSHLSTVRLIPDGVLESSPTPTPTSTVTPTETPTPTQTQIPTPTPVATVTPYPTICTGQVLADIPLNVRVNPDEDVVLGYLYQYDAIEILGAHATRSGDQITWWWYVRSIPRNLTGYVSAFWIQGNNCPDLSSIAQVPPVPTEPTGLCQFMIPAEQSLTVYYIDSLRTRTVLGQLVAGTTLTVYGRSLDNRDNYYYLINDPSDVPSQWRWVQATLLSLTNISPVEGLEAKRRACNYDYLPAFRFVDNNVSSDYVNAFRVYRTQFLSPIQNPIYGLHFNTDLYSGPSGHNGLDIVYKLDGINGSSVPITVVAPYDGVIVDVGPDAFVETYKVERVFESVDAIQPDWIRSCVAENRTGRACRNGVYLQTTRVDTNTPAVEVFIMFAITAANLSDSDEYRNDGWGGQGYGLTLEELDLFDRFRYTNLCSGSCSGPGRQVIVLYDIDNDAIPEIQTSYLHTVASNPNWNLSCSSTGQPPYAVWSVVRERSECQIGANSLLGTAEFIGFSSAPHLHYTVYIDRDSDGQFPSQDDETIDPLISIHMLR